MRVALGQALVDLGALDRLDETVISMLETATRTRDGGARRGGRSPLAGAHQGPRARERPPTAPEVRINAGRRAVPMSPSATDDPLAWKYRPLYLRSERRTRRCAVRPSEKICTLTGSRRRSLTKEEDLDVSHRRFRWQGRVKQP